MHFRRNEQGRLNLRPDSKFSFALLGSIIFHLLLLMGISKSETPERLFSADLDVVLVNSQSIRRVKSADALAQVDLQGGGNVDEQRVVTSSAKLDQIRSIERKIENANARVKSLEQSVEELLKLSHKRKEKLIYLDNDYDGAKEIGRGRFDANRQERQPTDRLRAKIDKAWNQYQKRPNRVFVGANVRRSEFASYVDSWRQEVERVGGVLYSRRSVDMENEGVMIVLVEIRSDGALESVEIQESSGSDLLDRLARDIVKESAPFASFDVELKQKYDVLSIIREWSFRRNDLKIK